MNTLEKYIQPLQDKVKELRKELDDFRDAFDVETLQKAYNTIFYLERQIRLFDARIEEWLKSNELKKVVFENASVSTSLIINAKGYHAKYRNLALDGEHNELSIKISKHRNEDHDDEIKIEVIIQKKYPTLCLVLEFMDDYTAPILDDLKNQLDIIRYISQDKISIEDYMAN